MAQKKVVEHREKRMLEERGDLPEEGDVIR